MIAKTKKTMPTTQKQQTNGVPKRATNVNVQPDKNWTSEQLTKYVKQNLQDRDDMKEQLAAIGRNSAVALFRAGHGLQVLRDKLKINSAWEQTLTDEGIGKGTANEAIRLYNKAAARWKGAAETELAKRTITEAKVELGVVKNKKVPKLGVPKGQNEQVRDAAKADRPPEVTRADEYLVAMANKLDQVVKWDRSDLDAKQLDTMARRCIALLSTFLMQKQVSPSKKLANKRKGDHAA